MLYSDLRATLSGRDLPEDVKQRLLAMHEENLNLKESYKTATDKLNKAKQVCIYLISHLRSNF
jgi:protein HOOK3